MMLFISPMSQSYIAINWLETVLNQLTDLYNHDYNIGVERVSVNLIFLGL